MSSLSESPRPDDSLPEHQGVSIAAASARAVRRRDRFILPVAIFLVSRIVLALVAHAAPGLLPALHKNPPLLPRSDPLAGAWSWFSPWFRFDAKWYVDVAARGYHWGRITQTNTNFYPLYPMLIKLVHPLTLGSYWIAALLVANVSFLAALILLWNWAFARWDRQVALRVVLLVTVFPFSFFFAAPYAESLFLALAVAAFLCADADRWTLAVCCAGLSAVTRPVGLAVIAALVVLALERRDYRRAVLACASILPFLLYVAYLGVAVGHPLGFAVYHTDGWVPPRGGFFHTIEIQFHSSLSPFDRVDVAVSLIFLVSAVAVWRRLGAPYALFVLLGVVLPLSKSLAGMERYVSVLFPVMAVWALARREALRLAAFAVSLFLLVLATSMFAAGYSLF